MKGKRTFDHSKEFLHLVGSIVSYTEGEGDEKPHKALLLLLALSRFRSSGFSCISFESAEDSLKGLIKRYSNSVHAHVEYPFWSLQNDRLWEVFSSHKLQYRKGKDFPPRPQLIKGEAAGKLPFWIERLLSRKPSLIDEAADLLLKRYFPSELRSKVRDAVGLGGKDSSDSETTGLI